MLSSSLTRFSSSFCRSKKSQNSLRILSPNSALDSNSSPSVLTLFLVSSRSCLDCSGVSSLSLSPKREQDSRSCCSSCSSLFLVLASCSSLILFLVSSRSFFLCLGSSSYLACRGFPYLAFAEGFPLLVSVRGVSSFDRVFLQACLVEHACSLRSAAMDLIRCQKSEIQTTTTVRTTLPQSVH